jgi:hypothetical protein
MLAKRPSDPLRPLTAANGDRIPGSRDVALKW